MRIIQSVGFYYPDSRGGTEVYVDSLTRNLQAGGIECIVAAPSPSEEVQQYTHQGAEIFRYPIPERWLRREVQGREPPRQFGLFEGWLRKQRADVYHQHSWTTGCGHWHLKAAKSLGLKTVVTVHVPGNVCLRGTMLREGRVACDGEILPERCAPCWLQWKGVPASAARHIGKLPQQFGVMEYLPRLGPLLAARALAAKRKNQLQEMTAAADRIVAVCGWLQQALLANGVPRTKLTLNRQGVGQPEQFRPSRMAKKTSSVFRFGFLGRWDSVKGVHVLVEAFKHLDRSLQVELDICAVVAGGDSKRYREEVQRSAVDDRRIRLLPEAPSERISDFFAQIDVLVVPSQWLETGPLVVLEAFAAGTPVIGSDLGGIKELVSHGRNGLLVPHDDVAALTTTMARMVTDRELLGRLRRGIGQVRTMSEVAHDMAMLYHELFAMRPHAA